MYSQNNDTISKLSFAYSNKNKVNTPKEYCTINTKIDIKHLVNIIKKEPPKALLKIHAIVETSLKKGKDIATIKKQIRPFKTQLPYFLFSGYCQKHHNDTSLENYNGCVQIDIDLKSKNAIKQALILKSKMSKLDCVLMCAISPSRLGVKALIYTENNNPNYHENISKGLIIELSKSLNIDKSNFDYLGLSQPCFIPYDANVHFNPITKPYDHIKAILDFEQSKHKKSIDVKKTHTQQVFNKSESLTPFKVLELATSEILSKNLNITDGYDNWFKVACSYASQGEKGRDLFHKVAALHNDYNFDCNNRKFDNALSKGKNKTPGYVLNICKSNGILIKDICKDYLRNLSPQKSTITGTTIKKHLGYKVEKFYLKSDQYISNVYRDNLTEKILLFLGGTGLGKTTLIKSYKHSIVTSFLTTTVENYGLEGFNCFNGEKGNYDKIDVLGSKKIATTFKSFSKVYEIKKSQFETDKDFYDCYVLVIDEFQQVLTESYANGDINSVLSVLRNHIKNGGKVRLLTANEIIPKFDILYGMEIKHFIKNQKLKPVTVFSYDNDLKLESFADFINKSQLSNRKIIGQTNIRKDNPSNDKILKNLKNTILNLDSTNKNEFSFNEGLKSSILSTTALNTGVNIYDQYTDSVIINNKDFTQISQFFGRLRYKNGQDFSTQNNTYTLFKNYEFTNNELTFNDCLNLAEKNLNYLKFSAKKEVKFCINKSITKNKNSHGSNVYWCNISDCAKVDELGINQKSHSYLNELINSSKGALIEMMKRQGYILEFKPYELEIINNEESQDDTFKDVVRAVILTALNNINEHCHRVIDSNEFACDYQGEMFIHYFKEAAKNDNYFKNIMIQYDKVSKVMRYKKDAFGVFFTFDKKVNIKRKDSIVHNVPVNPKRTTQRVMFANMYYKIESNQFGKLTDDLFDGQKTAKELIQIVINWNQQYKIELSKELSQKQKDGLTASLGVYSDLKKWFGSDFYKLVRNILLSHSASKDLKRFESPIVKVLSNHFTVVKHKKRLNRKMETRVLFDLIQQSYFCQ